MLGISLPENISLPEGYTIRPATKDDAEICVALFNACEQEQYGEQTARVDKLLGEWQHSKFNMETSTLLVFAPDGELAGYAELWDTEAPPVQVYYWARVHPQHRDKGIGTYMMRRGEKRAQQAIARCPADAQVALQPYCQLGHKPSQDLFENEGMHIIRYFWTMRIDDLDNVPAAQFLDGIEMRPMQYPDEFEKVVEATNDAFRDHWGHVEQPLEKEIAEWREWIAGEPDFDPSVWFLAIDTTTDDIAGTSLCMKKARNNHRIGGVDSLGVRRPWRRKGLALAMLRYSFRQLQAIGNESVILGVDASSLTGATKLYEKAGMRVERQTVVYEKILRPGKNLVTTSVEA